MKRNHFSGLLFCMLFVSAALVIPLHAQKKASPAPKGQAPAPKKEVLPNNPFSKIHKELDAAVKAGAESSSQRRKLRNRLDYLAKKLESQLKNKLEVLETKKRHLEGRLMVCPSGKKEAVKKQIAAVEKQIELYKNTADQEKYKALIEKKVKELTSSSSSSKARKDKKDKKSKKSKKSKKK